MSVLRKKNTPFLVVQILVKPTCRFPEGGEEKREEKRKSRRSQYSRVQLLTKSALGDDPIARGEHEFPPWGAVTQYSSRSRGEKEEKEKR